MWRCAARTAERPSRRPASARPATKLRSAGSVSITHRAGGSTDRCAPNAPRDHGAKLHVRVQRHLPRATSRAALPHRSHRVATSSASCSMRCSAAAGGANRRMPSMVQRSMRRQAGGWSRRSDDEPSRQCRGEVKARRCDFRGFPSSAVSASSSSWPSSCLCCSSWERAGSSEGDCRSADRAFRLKWLAATSA